MKILFIYGFNHGRIDDLIFRQLQLFIKIYFSAPTNLSSLQFVIYIVKNNYTTMHSQIKYLHLHIFYKTICLVGYICLIIFRIPMFLIDCFLTMFNCYSIPSEIKHLYRDSIKEFTRFKSFMMCSWKKGSQTRILWGSLKEVFLISWR